MIIDMPGKNRNSTQTYLDIGAFIGGSIIFDPEFVIPEFCAGYCEEEIGVPETREASRILHGRITLRALHHTFF